MQLLDKAGLTASELEQIAELAQLCERTGNLRIKLNWDMLKTRPAHETNDFFITDGSRLIGFLALYQFRRHEAEISGMVHPAYRRKGVFSQLAEAARRECMKRGADQLLFICPHASDTGHAWLKQAGCEYQFSEYVMDWQDKNMTHPGRLNLVQAGQQDVEQLVRLNCVGFNMEEAEARDYVEKSMDREIETTYMALLNGTPIGKIGCGSEGEEVLIYGFCVGPAYRGNGHGREMLAAIVQMCVAKQYRRIYLEVSTDNDHALKLYEDCGFKIVTRNDYYELRIRK